MPGPSAPPQPGPVDEPRVDGGSSSTLGFGQVGASDIFICFHPCGSLRPTTRPRGGEISQRAAQPGSIPESSRSQFCSSGRLGPCVLCPGFQGAGLLTAPRQKDGGQGGGLADALCKRLGGSVAGRVGDGKRHGICHSSPPCPDCLDGKCLDAGSFLPPASFRIINT